MRVGLVVLVPLLVANIPSVAGASSKHSTTPTTNVCGILHPLGGIDQTEVNACLRTDFPDTFAGMYTSSHGAYVIVVEEVGHTRSLETAARNTLRPFHVSFEVVRHTYAELTALAQELRADKPLSARFRGATGSGVGAGMTITHDSVTVTVGTKTTHTKVLNYFHGRYGDLVRVQFISPDRNIAMGS